MWGCPVTITGLGRYGASTDVSSLYGGSSFGVGGGGLSSYGANCGGSVALTYGAGLG